ncbi:MAG TPA: hypothetical protein VGG33_20270 [Polyangia bacterium]
MAQDRMSSWDEDAEVRSFDDWGSEDSYDVDMEDENPNLWESDVESLAALAASREGDSNVRGRHAYLVDSAVSRWP